MVPLKNIPPHLLDSPGFLMYQNAVQRPYRMPHVHCDDWENDIHTCDKPCIKMEMPFNVNRRMSTTQLIRDEPRSNGRTLLLCAITGRAWRLKLDFIKTVLSVPGINVNKGDSYGRTPLLFAIKQNNEEIVKLLLKAPGIDVNKKCAREHTFPLLEAVATKNVNIVRRLLFTPGIDVNQCDWNRTSAYASVCTLVSDTPNNEAYLEILALLSAFPGIKTRGVHLPQGKYPCEYGYNSYGQSNGYQLLRAVTLGHHDVVANLLQSLNVDVNLSNMYDFFLRVVTDEENSSIGTTGIVGKFLTQQAQSVIERLNKATTPRFLSVRMSDGRHVRRRILSQQQTLNLKHITKNKDYSYLFAEKGPLPPLAVAVLRNDVDMVRLLVAHPTINVNYLFPRHEKDVKEGCSLLYAAKLKNPEMERLLLTHPDIDDKLWGFELTPDEDGPTWSPLYPFPSSRRSQFFFEMDDLNLFKPRVEPDLEEFKRWYTSSTFNRVLLHDGTKWSQSLFLKAVHNEHRSVLEYMMDTLTQKQKNRGFLVAATHGCASLVELFLKHGANINARDNRGRTALALLCNDRRSVEQLTQIQRLLSIKPQRPDRKDKIRLLCKDVDGKTALDLARAQEQRLAFLVEKHLLLHNEVQGIAELTLFAGTAAGRLIPQLPPDLGRLIATYLLPVRPEGVVGTTFEKQINAAKVRQHVDAFLEDIEQRYMLSEEEEEEEVEAVEELEQEGEEEEGEVLVAPPVPRRRDLAHLP